MKKFVASFKANVHGGFMDVEEYNGHIYAIQRSSQYIGGRLCVFDKELNLISSYEGIGNARQVKINNGIAVISARSNGIWILDVKGNMPKLLSHYQTIELATGVTLYSNLAFISCRQYGVEIVDLKDPEKPVHKGIIRVGEVQSACVYKNVLYCGLWGDMKVKAVDIRDISDPSVIGEFDLDGRGDGVVVKDDMLYAVCGQHARGIKNYSDINDSCYGHGNGIHVFDISDINTPKNVFSDKLGYGYSVQFDMWKPILCGDMLVCADSILGVHIYNAKSFEKIAVVSLPNISGKDDAVTGIVSMHGKLYISGAFGGLYCFDGLKFDLTYKFNIEKSIEALKGELKYDTTNDLVQVKVLYQGDFPVLAIEPYKEKYYVLACGDEGMHILDKNTFKCLYTVKANGFCCDVKTNGEYIYAAFSEDGINVYRIIDNNVVCLGGYKEDKAIQQMCLSKNGRYLACCLESTEVIMLDVSDKANIVKIFARKAKYGPLYGENFTSNPLKDGTMLMFWHRDGIIYSNPEKCDTEFKDIFYNKRNGFMGFGPENGCDTDGEYIYYNLDGGYVILPFTDGVEVDDLVRYKATYSITGKFVVTGGILISVERAKGEITVTDISDVYKPKSIARINISACCMKPKKIENDIFIPSWYDGLLQLK